MKHVSGRLDWGGCEGGSVRHTCGMLNEIANRALTELVGRLRHRHDEYDDMMV